ncbi:Atg27p [Nannizzia gypsea CBS 118893]|uniref:Autophagy-related protein 27 n=1 Tax=Arthroderma gypseum (strain ATCC MYA-4604 / CBS 118893) TaxID=535722 RepID=E4V1U3_ARTGP|nr:Atg27p [Nannizzia gypsea CBS 118893]EFR04008.1 Atg27p [Nannizzia gypsea CBS 118893]
MARYQGLSILSLFAVFSSLASAELDCSHIKVDGVSWDLSKLGGAHSVMETTSTHGDFNTTYTLDICKPLTKSMCKKGAFVCAVRNATDINGIERTMEVIDIAGNFVLDSGKTLDPIFTRLKKENPSTEGLKMELHGGKHKVGDVVKKQKAVFTFLCDPERTGLEGLEDAKPDDDKKKDDEKKGDDKKDSKDKDGKSQKREEENSKSLVYKGYNEEQGTLELEWRTKYACENVEGGGNTSSGHWGFFTWLIVLLFLCTAAYLIFGSWLNYSRYGARGWDLLPHSDTIRDIPYILKDWARRVVNTLQGGGTRGGYSAV